MLSSRNVTANTIILAAWMMVFAGTLRELSMAILLYVPGTETLPGAIYSFIDNGTFEIAAAVSVLLILMRSEEGRGGKEGGLAKCRGGSPWSAPATSPRTPSSWRPG